MTRRWQTYAITYTDGRYGLCPFTADYRGPTMRVGVWFKLVLWTHRHLDAHVHSRIGRADNEWYEKKGTA